jgi:3-hydroxyisobutyrate dehydrogenase-like beta-hydroxyacid dehydrogenase
MRIGFIGLGNMGAAIAGNLVRAQHDVLVWNRSADKARALVAAGAVLAPTPEAAAADRQAVFTMLADDAALHTVLTGEHGLLAGLEAGAVHVSMSTVAVATTEKMAAMHAARGQRLLCAPVFGRPDSAAAAKLFVVAAGDSAALETVKPVLDAMSQRTFYVGEKPFAASLIKLCGNFMMLAAIEALGEAMALAQKGGIPKGQLLEILTGTLFDSPVYRNYGAILVADRFKPAGFAAPLGLKDMRLVAESSDALRVPMPVLNVLRDHLLQTIAQQGDDMDWSGIAHSIAKNAGL